MKPGYIMTMFVDRAPLMARVWMMFFYVLMGDRDVTVLAKGNGRPER